MLSYPLKIILIYDLIPFKKAASVSKGLLAVLVIIVSTSAIAADSAWKKTLRADPINHQSVCLLVSPAKITSDGYESTPVQLLFNGSSLVIATESELDGAFKDLQLLVDDKPPMHSDKIINKNFLVFDANVAELVKLMRAGQQITVNLRFWPTWPATHSFPIKFSLIGFSKAHDMLSKGC
jgi:hypothetical protein